MKTVFIGYPFALDHVHRAAASAFEGVADVVTARDRITSQHILDKIELLMAESTLCLFDLTLHNVNVALEFGLARGKGFPYRLLYDETNAGNPKEDVFSDARGWDSLRYTSEDHLRAELIRAIVPIVQELPERHIAEAALPDARILSVRPHMHLRIGGGISGSGGSYLVGTLKNVGRGVARNPRLTLPGLGNVELDALVKPGETLELQRIRYDDKPVYTERLTDPTFTVEFEDESGIRYKQVGEVEQKMTPGGVVLTYTVTGLGPIREVH